MKSNLLKLLRNILFIVGLPLRLIINETSIRFLYPFPFYRNHIGEKYLSFTFRDKIPKGEIEIQTSFDDYGILIQGPISFGHDFTLNTIIYYIKNFPGAKIVLSTWENKNLNLFNGVEGLFVINNSLDLNDIDKWDMNTNMNFQIVSTFNGLSLLKDLGAKYVIKSRTDMRFYDNQLLKNLTNLSIFFDPGENKRIITLDHNCLSNIPFHLDDSFQFGSIDKLIALWSVKRIYKVDTKEKELILENVKLKYGIQAYLFMNYVKNNVSLEQSDFSFSESMNIIVEYFIMIPREIIGTYWIKYQKKENFSKKTSYDNEFNNRIAFSDWLDFEILRKSKITNT